MHLFGAIDHIDHRCSLVLSVLFKSPPRATTRAITQIILITHRKETTERHHGTRKFTKPLATCLRQQRQHTTPKARSIKPQIPLGVTTPGQRVLHTPSPLRPPVLHLQHPSFHRVESLHVLSSLFSPIACNIRLASMASACGLSPHASFHSIDAFPVHFRFPFKLLSSSEVCFSSLSIPQLSITSFSKLSASSLQSSSTPSCPAFLHPAHSSSVCCSVRGLLTVCFCTRFG